MKNRDPSGRFKKGHGKIDSDLHHRPDYWMEIQKMLKKRRQRA